MKRILFIVLLSPFFTFSQKVIDVKKDDANPIRDGLFYVVAGVPFSPAKYVEVVSGTPFFNEDFMPADLLLAGGGQRKNVPIKLDLYSNDLIYKDSLGNELIATTVIRQATIHDRSTGKDAVFINSKTIKLNGREPEHGWYQLIESGNASLYKKIEKTIKERRAYNSATTEQTIYSANKYFIEAYGVFTEIKKPKEMVEALTDKSKEMEAYISSNKINVKDEKDWKSAVAYYNSLPSK